MAFHLRTVSDDSEFQCRCRRPRNEYKENEAAQQLIKRKHPQQ